ncbi:MAG: hypothetical protein ACPLZG_12935 [Thermoproteota archaeon]
MSKAKNEIGKILSKTSKTEKILNKIADSLIGLYASEKIDLDQLLYMLESYSNLKKTMDDFYSAVEDVKAEVGEKK